VQLVRSGIAVGAGFAVFSVIFAVLGPGLGAVLTTLAAGLIAGYLTAKIAGAKELTHGGATAGLVAASLVVQAVLSFPARLLVAGIAIAAITGGAWVRAQGRRLRAETIVNQHDTMSRHSPRAEGGEGPS
jgi:hypothetical protein